MQYTLGLATNLVLATLCLAISNSGSYVVTCIVRFIQRSLTSNLAIPAVEAGRKTHCVQYAVLNYIMDHWPVTIASTGIR